MARIIGFCFVMLLSKGNCLGQAWYQTNLWQRKFDSALYYQDNVNNLKNLLYNSKKGNSFLFMNLSYPVDGLLTMFKATNDKRYLEICHSIIKNVINSSDSVRIGHENVFIWKADSTDQRNKNVEGKEVILFEGYLIRYFAEYCYILSTIDNGFKEGFEFDKIHAFVVDEFLKWYYRSIQQFGNASLLETTRTHMGSHWAAIANYLYQIENDKKRKGIFFNVFTKYNEALKKNLKIKTQGSGNQYYVWNSTWDSSVKSGSVVQDISHGNQVVRYILDCYEIDSTFWKRADIDRFIKTLKLKILSSTNLPDNVDGSSSNDRYLINSGWRLSDGWMRLMFYDKTLFNDFLTLYLRKKQMINRSSFNLEFYSNFTFYLHLPG